MRRINTKSICLLSLLFVFVGATFLRAEKEKKDERPLKEVLGELKNSNEQGKREKNFNALKGRRPATKEDIEALSQTMESDMAPIAQEVISRTNDASLAPDILKACEEKSKGMKTIKEADYNKLSPDERKREVHRRMNLGVLIEVLGNLKDKKSIPTLKKFLDDESLTYAASTALSRMGDEEVFKELMQRMENQKEINLAGIKAPRLKSILKEIDDPKTTIKKKGKLIGQIKGTRDPEVNKMLKELALKHKDGDVRSQAGLALVNSIIADKSVGDSEFLAQWASMEAKDDDEEWARGWVVDAMRKAWNSRFIPILIKILSKKSKFAPKSEAARLLGEHKAVEAVPYLEEMMRSDRDGHVRGEAWAALNKITAKTYLLVHPDDVRGRIEYLKRFPQDRCKDEIYSEEKK